MARNVTARAVHFRRGLNFFTLSNKPFIHSNVRGGRGGILMWAQGGQVLDSSRTWSPPRPAGIPDWNLGYVEAGDPRWRGKTTGEEVRRGFDAQAM